MMQYSLWCCCVLHRGGLPALPGCSAGAGEHPAATVRQHLHQGWVLLCRRPWKIKDKATPVLWFLHIIIIIISPVWYLIVLEVNKGFGWNCWTDFHVFQKLNILNDVLKESLRSESPKFVKSCIHVCFSSYLLLPEVWALLDKIGYLPGQNATFNITITSVFSPYYLDIAYWMSVSPALHDCML